MQRWARWSVLGPAVVGVTLVLAVIAALGAVWVIPYRLAFGPEGSYYTFGFIGDEYTYAERIQAFVAGATASNPINGVSDPRYISTWYLENFLRLFLQVLHLDVIAFAWGWRILFPVGLLASFVALTRACMPADILPKSTQIAVGPSSCRYCSTSTMRSPTSRPSPGGSTGFRRELSTSSRHSSRLRTSAFSDDGRRRTEYGWPSLRLRSSTSDPTPLFHGRRLLRCQSSSCSCADVYRSLRWRRPAGRSLPPARLGF